MEKDIRFTEKKVDENWKEQTSKEKGKIVPPGGGAAQSSPQSKADEKPSAAATSKIFLNLLSSLGVQAMMHLGEIPNPETREKEINLEAAREIIDLLAELRKKTTGNLSAQETEFFSQVLPELQMKFAKQL